MMLQKIFDIILKPFNFIIKLFRDSKWSYILLIIAFALICILAYPIYISQDTPLFQVLSEILTEGIYYPLFIIAVVLVLAAFVVELAGFNQPIRLNSRVLFILLLGVLIALFWIYGYIITSQLIIEKKGDKFSWGEEYLINSKISSENPELKIYKNNLKAILQNKNPKKIAVSVPISRYYGDKDSEEILRGVALSQEQWNKKNPKSQVIVAIADDGYKNDGDEETKATEIATLLAKRKEILGVIGHFSSEATEVAANIYEQNKLVTISPTSTAVRENNKNQVNDNEDITNTNMDKVILNSYIFRTSPNDNIAANKIIDKIPNNIYNIAIIYEQKNVYSRSFRSSFSSNFGENKIINIPDGQWYPNKDDCNISTKRNADNPLPCLDKAKKQNAALLLIPATKNTEKVKKILNENYKNEYSLKLFGADGMYKQEYIQNEEGEASDKTSGMLVAVAWHRSDDKCTSENENSEKENFRLECKAAKLFSPKNSQQKEKYSPLPINWRTATAYDATQALLYGLKKTSEKKCRFFIINRNNCLRNNLKSVLLDDFKADGVLGKNTVQFDTKGDRRVKYKGTNEDIDGLGVVVKVEDGNFLRVD